MANTPIKIETLPSLSGIQQNQINQRKAARGRPVPPPYIPPTVPVLNPVWNTGVPAPVFPTPKELTPAETVSNKTTAAIGVGATNGTNMGNADRKAGAAQTLMGGDMGSFVSNLLRMFAQPEFQQAGFAGQGFGPTVLGATKALRAMETQDAEMEKARLEALANVEAAGPSFDLSSQSIELVEQIKLWKQFRT
jgi:hypothetical protein